MELWYLDSPWQQVNKSRASIARYVWYIVVKDNIDVTVHRYESCDNSMYIRQRMFSVCEDLNHINMITCPEDHILGLVVFLVSRGEDLQSRKQNIHVFFLQGSD